MFNITLYLVCPIKKIPQGGKSNREIKWLGAPIYATSDYRLAEACRDGYLEAGKECGITALDVPVRLG